LNQCGFANGPGKATVPPMRDAWYLLRSGPGEPAFNMAADQALLDSVGTFGFPVLRFYSWSRPAATFGYFQRHADIAALTPLRPLIRRSTGGGLVPHDADWTYSLAVPTGHPWYHLAAADSYARIHQWVCDAFQVVGIPTQLAPCCDPSGPGQCFIGSEKSDLLHLGRKIAGAAQRRSRLGLLIQGSVQPPVVADRTAWEAAMESVGREQAGIDWLAFPNRDAFSIQSRLLADSVYGTVQHNERR